MKDNVVQEIKLYRENAENTVFVIGPAKVVAVCINLGQSADIQ